ncbi:MAG: hypothetical protein IPG39_08245 [Bacteroidetes bacterium]|nr:hypothetical protein [Bacteroidota bacterium]
MEDILLPKYQSKIYPAGKSSPKLWKSTNPFWNKVEVINNSDKEWVS